MKETIINKFILLIIIKDNYAYKLNLNEISELKTKLNLYIKY